MSGKTTTLQFPEGTTVVPSYSAKDCKGLHSVRIPDGITELDPLAFFNAPLEEIYLPDSLERINDSAFHGTKLEFIFIPASVREIDENAFSGTRLFYIFVSPRNPYFADVDGVLFSKDRSRLLFYPSQRKAATYRIPTGTKSIAPRAFLRCPNLKKVICPASLRQIGDNAFAQCTQLQEVRLPKLESIGSQAFLECKKLRKVRFGGSVKKIGSSAFQDCDLRKLKLPSGTIELDPLAFSRNTLLRKVLLPGSLLKLSQPFSGCTSLENIRVSYLNPNYYSRNGVLFTKDHTLVCYPAGRAGDYMIPEGVTRLGSESFYQARVRDLQLPESILFIPADAIYKCPHLRTIVVPPSVSKVPNTVDLTKGFMLLGGAEELTDGFCEGPGAHTVIIREGTKKLGKHLLRNFRTTTLILPESLREISAFAVANCQNLHSVTLPDGLEFLGDYAFSATALSEIRLPACLKYLGCHVFQYCHLLQYYYADEENPLFTAVNGVLFSKDMKTLLAYPCARYGSYTVPDGITELADHAFEDCHGLVDISFPDTLTKLGCSVFRNCGGLCEVYFPQSLQNFPKDTFADSLNIKKVLLPAHLTNQLENGGPKDERYS